MKLLVGLGNPGDKYAANRHNVGFLAVDAIARSYGLPAWRRRFEGLATEGEISGTRALLLKPQTYMNESGRAVGDAARWLKIGLSEIVVFHDELDLAPGKLKVKTGGGNAGHNGLRSITAHLGNDYARVRIGIGHPGAKELVHGWVLSDFAKADRAWLEPLLAAMAEAAPWITAGKLERFLTDVARLTAPEGPAPERKPPPATAPSRPTAGNPTGHPAGERAGKRQSALAENLRKWLSGRQKPD